MGHRGWLAVGVLALAMTFLLPGAAASHCGNGILTLTTSPTGATLDTTPLLQAVFQDTPQTCGIEFFGMTLDGASVTAIAYTSGSTYVVEYQVTTPLANGFHQASAWVSEVCCNNDGLSADHGSADWVFVVRSQPTVPVSVPVAVPGAAQGLAVPSTATPPVGSQAVGTPPLTVPATCTAGPCTSPTVVPSHSATSPAVPVSQACAPAGVVCVGPFTVPSQTVGPTPSQTLPAVCTLAGAACLPPTVVPGTTLLVTPPVASLPLTPASSVSVAFTGLTGSVTPNAGQLGTIGPVTVLVPAPLIGNIPVTVCATPCPAPVAPQGALSGSLTVTATVGTTSQTVTVPVSVSA